MSAVADVLDRAAAAIRRNGHHKGDYYNQAQLSDGRNPADCAVCAHGAINSASGGAPTNDYLPGAHDAVGAVLTWLLEHGRLGDHLSLVSWNDDSVRTPDEVLEALEGAATAERAKGGAA